MRAAFPVRRLAIILSHPNQYYSPWFRWLATHSTEQITLRVFYLWKGGVTAQHDPGFQKSFQWDVDLLEGYEHEFVPNNAPRPGSDDFHGLRNPTLTARLAAWRPDAILLFGYAYATHLRVIAWARRHGVPLIFRGDSHLLGRPTLPLLSRQLLRVLYAQFAAFLPVGAANRDYFLHLRAPTRKLFFAPHAVDHTLFDPARSDHHAATAKLRHELQLPPDTIVILFAGKFIPAKQPQSLLHAFLELAPPRSALIFVGDGPEKPALLDLARCAPAGSVHFLPFANQSEMPSRLLLADIFALPSHGRYETWGLAVNEALHLGVPALVSDVVGCQRDLVTENETGWIFPADDTPALRTALATAIHAVADPAVRERFRRNAIARVSRYTYPQTTVGLLAALASLPRPALSRRWAT